MSIQDLFKEYYSKAKTVDAKEYVNSAKTSINSFSSLLEKRRQKAQKKEDTTTTTTTEEQRDKEIKEKAQQQFSEANAKEYEQKTEEQKE